MRIFQLLALSLKLGDDLSLQTRNIPNQYLQILSAIPTRTFDTH